MNREIDFLKAYGKKIKPKRDVFGFFKNGLLLFLVIYCFLLLGSFLYLTILKRKYQRVVAQAEDVVNEIKRQEKKESLYFLIKKRLSYLSELINKEENSFHYFFPIITLAGEKVKISELEISNDKVIISGTAPDAFSMGGFLEEVVNPEIIRSFSKASLTSLSRKEDGSYNFSMTIIYGKK